MIAETSAKVGVGASALLCALVLTSCASTIPSASSGTSTPSFGDLADLPRMVAVHSSGIPHYDPVGDVLRAELPALGFTVVPQDPEGTFTATVEYSDFSPVRLEIALSDVKTGRAVWSAQLTRQWDIYASVVSASESNARKAMELFRRDLAAAEARR